MNPDAPDPEDDEPVSPVEEFIGRLETARTINRALGLPPEEAPQTYITLFAKTNREEYYRYKNANKRHSRSLLSTLLRYRLVLLAVSAVLVIGITAFVVMSTRGKKGVHQ